MKSRLPKVLHRLAGKSMVERVVETVQRAGCDRVVVVVGHGADQVRAVLTPDVRVALQAEQLGTAHAVLAARSESPAEGHVVIVNGDVPLLRPETVEALIAHHVETRSVLSLLSCDQDDPAELGRIVRDASGRMTGIVEARDATREQLEIRETNRGLYCADAGWLWPVLESLPAAPSGEFYLTDAVHIAVQSGRRVEAVLSDDPEETAGVNDRVQLAATEASVWRRTAERLMRAGVTIRDPRSCYVDDEVEIGTDSVIEPGTHLRGRSRIGAGCTIGPNTLVRDSEIGDHCTIVASWIEEAIVGDGVEVGPFSHLRSGAVLDDHVHIGNFAEVKNSHLGADSKMGHFSYLGDADLGERVNVGAGTITCNYDGVRKNKTVVGDDVFIGSDTMLVAPLRLGDRSTTGAGSVVTRDVPADALAVGVPARIRSKVSVKPAGE